MVNALLYTGDIILLLNLILYFGSYRKSSVALNFFCFFLLHNSIIEIITSFYFESGQNNLYLSHYYFIGQFILLSQFFKHILEINTLINIVLIIVLTSLIIYYYYNPDYYFKFNIFEIIVTSIPLLIYSFIFFVKKLDDTNKKFIYIISGFFLYTLCSTLLFTTGNIKAEIKNIIWYTNALLYLIYQMLIFTEWYRNIRKTNLKI